MIKLKSYAKINLYLDIGKKLDNGYHRIKTIFQTIDLFDIITIKAMKKPIYQIESDNPEVPVGKNSIIYRAVKEIMKENKSGISIKINKNIPLSSGLGGGSSNVASILLGICKLCNISATYSKLIDISTELGMDIPFFIKRGTVYAEGRGEKLFPLITAGIPLYIVLVNPGIRISTKWAYDTFDKEKKLELNTIDVDIDSYINQKETILLSEIRKYIYNRFDSIICKEYPIISRIKDHLKELGAFNATISGSGPTVYGIMENKRKALEVFNKLKPIYPFVYATRTIGAKNIFFDNFS